MSKIIDYIIVSPQDQYGNIVTDYIQRRIEEGWQPHGGLCSYNTVNNNNYLYQAMVKYEESE